jgi:uncharacterized membrane protein YvbJ
MKYCPTCGAQLPDNAAFCSNCGARLGIAQPQYQQPQYQQPQYQQPQYQQPAPQKKSYMDRVREAREAQKQKQGKIKWWMWALIAIGTYLLIQWNPLGLS